MSPFPYILAYHIYFLYQRCVYTLHTHTHSIPHILQNSVQSLIPALICFSLPFFLSQDYNACLWASNNNITHGYESFQLSHTFIFGPKCIAFIKISGNF